ncbi:MAG: hypothetical protein JWM32_1530 [Verrucomicrobia bacterium]|nr:hypothetical protein [Verrucomicrobiota bacterium]
MATRLLSFLHSIEQALLANPAARTGGTWETQRIVNYKQGLARMTLTPIAAATDAFGGTIFLQSFVLADGSICLKANLGWDGSEAAAQVAVYSKPEVDWLAEARQIAQVWLAGPPAVGIVENAPVLTPAMSQLSAVAG